MKNVRVLLLIKTARTELKKQIHPQAVVPVRYNGRTVEQDILFNVAGFIILYLVVFASATVLIAATGQDLLTSMSAVASSMSNVGPGLAEVGPMTTYDHMTDFAKWLLSACMILGRLELFTVFVLFSRTFWQA